MIQLKRANGRVIQTLPAAAQASARVPSFPMVAVTIKRRRLTQEDLGQIRLWDAETHKMWQRYYQ